MKIHTLVVMCAVMPLTVQAISMTAADTTTSEKIRYMQNVSGTDHSRMAAFVQADQAFTQWCGRAATVDDLKRIKGQEGFVSLYTQLKTGKSLGMTQTKSLLMKDNPQFCKR